MEMPVEGALHRNMLHRNEGTTILKCSHDHDATRLGQYLTGSLKNGVSCETQQIAKILNPSIVIVMRQERNFYYGAIIDLISLN